MFELFEKFIILFFNGIFKASGTQSEECIIKCHLMNQSNRITDNFIKSLFCNKKCHESVLHINCENPVKTSHQKQTDEV